MVYVPVNKIWEYVQENKVSLKSTYHLVAEDTDTKIKIYLTIADDNSVEFAVDFDGETEFELGAASKETAEEAYEIVLGSYVCDGYEPYSGDKDLDDDDIPVSDDVEDRFVELGYADRVDEILCATEDLLAVLFEHGVEAYGITNDDMDRIVETVEAILWDEYGFSVYHPIIEDGVIVKYPFTRDEK